MSTPIVSVVIVNWNGLHFLRGCFAALVAQTYRDFEIIVVDNASTDGSVELLQRDYPSIRLIENQNNVGFAVANNQALAHCRGRLVALLNNDTAAAPDWLGRLVAALEAHPDAAGACGTTVALNEPDRVIFTLPKIDPHSARAIWVKQASPLTDVDYLSGSGMLVRRAVIDQLGFFDPVYVAYYEETDWCARALRAGYRLLYVPEAVIAHKEMGSASSEFHAYQMARNRLRFALKNFDADRLPRFLLHYTIDAARVMAGNIRDGRPWHGLLFARAVAWNLRHLPATLAARHRDLRRIGPNCRSYNRSLPLRDRTTDGCGDLYPARARS
jgi:hypothetical protein